MAEWQLRKTGKKDAKTESRMLFLQIGMVIMPCGLVIFAWMAEEQLHWVLPLLGTALLTIGMLMAFVYIQTYLVDVYGKYSANALAAMITTRNLGSCIFSIVGFQLYESLGYGWQVFLPRILKYCLMTFFLLMADL